MNGDVPIDLQHGLTTFEGMIRPIKLCLCWVVTRYASTSCYASLIFLFSSWICSWSDKKVHVVCTYNSLHLQDFVCLPSTSCWSWTSGLQFFTSTSFYWLPEDNMFWPPVCACFHAFEDVYVNTIFHSISFLWLLVSLSVQSCSGRCDEGVWEMGYTHNRGWTGRGVCLVFLRVYVGILFCFVFMHQVVIMIEMMNFFG